MNLSIRNLSQVASKESRKIIGLMSGTSLDGLDVALCNIHGTGEQTRLELLQFKTCEYPVDIAERLKGIVSLETISLEELCLGHTWLADYHADLVLETLSDWNLEPVEIDCIASHGQTVYHAPFIKHQKKGMPNATLQIGDGDHIARKTGILTLSDFRQKHTSAGGEGAPMASLVDRMLYTDPSSDRILLNIGGIANFSYLPSKQSEEDYATTDTGPGNTLINAAMQRYYNREFDKDGTVSASGRVHAVLLKEMKRDPYFKQPFPKTTGPEKFNLNWVEKCRSKAGVKELPEKDLVATLTWLSAGTINDAVRQIAGGDEQQPELYLSGGGMHNKTMISWLKDLMEGYSIESFETIGYNPDAKEAVSFAVLANEALAGEGFLIDPKSGAERRVNFGKVSFPV